MGDNSQIQGSGNTGVIQGWGQYTVTKGGIGGNSQIQDSVNAGIIQGLGQCTISKGGIGGNSTLQGSGKTGAGAIFSQQGWDG